MSYWDTSALGKLYVPEADSADFDQKAARDPLIITSSLARLEMHRIAFRKEAEGQIPADTAICAHRSPSKKRSASAMWSRHSVRRSTTLRPPQHARAVTRIQPALDRSREALVVFPLHLRRPRLRMQPQPDRAFLLQPIAQFLRHRIPEMKRHEYTAPVCCQCGSRFSVRSMCAYGLKKRKSSGFMQWMEVRPIAHAIKECAQGATICNRRTKPSHGVR